MDKMQLTFNSEIKGIDEREGTLTAYVSTKGRDRMDEVLEPDGADMRNFKANPVVLFGHRYDEPPIGKALWIKKDGDGIIAKVKFASTEFAQEIFGLFKEGFMRAFSVGFIPKEWEDGDGQKKARRTYKKWELLEFSAVPVPANPEALMLAIKRGLSLSEPLKQVLKLGAQAASTDPGDPQEETTEPETEAPVTEPELPIQDAPPKNYMNEIKAMEEEISQLKQTEQANLSIIAGLRGQLSELRYRIYTQARKPDAPKKEISGEDLAKMIRDVVSGEIARVRGRVS